MLRLLPPLVLLAACQTTGMSPPATPSAPATDPAACGADALQGMIGAPAAEVQQAAGLAITRTYMEGDPVTLDYLPERLNIVTDGSGRVIELRCG